ncbi:MAG: hypothetical protein KL785_00760 [Brevundimonas sp.]|nr:hypothetical protein [Brevundimonas sp.]
MTDPDRTSSADIDEQADRIADDAEAMDRPDRAIPLPDESGEEDEGVGEVTGIVP